MNDTRLLRSKSFGLLLAVWLVGLVSRANASSIVDDPVFVSLLNDVEHATAAWTGLNESGGADAVAITRCNDRVCALSRAWARYQRIPWWDDEAVVRHGVAAAITASSNVATILMVLVSDQEASQFRWQRNTSDDMSWMPFRDNVRLLMHGRQAALRCRRTATAERERREMATSSTASDLAEAESDVEACSLLVRGVNQFLVDRRCSRLARAVLEESTQLLGASASASWGIGDRLAFEEKQCSESLRHSLLRTRYDDGIGALECLARRCGDPGLNETDHRRDPEACVALAAGALSSAHSELRTDLAEAVVLEKLRNDSRSVSTSAPSQAMAAAERALAHLADATRALDFLGVFGKTARLAYAVSPSSENGGVDGVGANAPTTSSLPYGLCAVAERLACAKTSLAERLGVIGASVGDSEPPIAEKKSHSTVTDDNTPSVQNDGRVVVGIFVLRTPERGYVVDAPGGPALAQALRSVWFEAPELRGRARLHILSDFLPAREEVVGQQFEHRDDNPHDDQCQGTSDENIDENAPTHIGAKSRCLLRAETRAWRVALGTSDGVSAAVWGGAHIVRSTPLPYRPERGNYLRKMCVAGSDRCFITKL